MIAPIPAEPDPLAGIGFAPHEVDERNEQARYLREYRKLGQKRSAAHRSGVPWGDVIRWEKTDDEFAERQEETYQLHVEGIIREAYRRAIVGEPRLKFHKGDPITVWNEETQQHELYIEHQKSDKLLIELLAVLDPRFQQRGKSATEVNISNSTNLVLGVVENPSFYGNNAHEMLDGKSTTLIECEPD